MKKRIYRIAAIHCFACKDNAAYCVMLTLVMMFFINLIEAQLEELIFGERFLHWGDPIIWTLGFAYSFLVIRVCAIRNQIT